MKMIVDELPEGGLEFDLAMDVPWARRAAQEALDGEPVALQGHIFVHRVGPGVMVEGASRARVERTCDRCLARVALSVDGRLSLYFERPPAAGGEFSLAPDELDVGFVEGGILDLEQVLTEFLVLEGPDRVRCQDAGVERLQPGPCEIEGAGGRDEVMDPRLSALQGFRSGDEDEVQ